MIDFKLPKNKKYKMLKTAYFRPLYDDRWCMTNRDFILCTIKNIETNETILKIFPEPEIDYYMVKDFSSVSYPMLSIESDKVEKHSCLYRDRDKALLTSLGLWKEAYALKKTNYEAYKKFLEQNVRNSPYLYAADTNIEDYYKTQFELQYGTFDSCPLKKSYFDIEVDVSEEDATENDPRGAITVITYFVEEMNTMYAFCLDLPDNEKQQKLKANLYQFLLDYLSEEEMKGNSDPIKFSIDFFNREVDLLRAFFSVFHEAKADYISAWNSPFDVKYIINRAVLLGMDVPKLICSPEIPDEFKRINYLADPDRDRQSSKYFHRLWDWVDAANYTMVVDAMSLYSNLRKRYQLQSYSLYNVSLVELGVTKVNLPFYGLTIRNAHVLDYPRFLQYAITDTFLLYQLESKTDDISRFTAMCENTRISKGVNISIIIKNILYLDFFRNGKVIGNSILYNNWTPIQGAIVASPSNIKIASAKIYGESKTNVYDSVIDLK